MSQDDDDEDEEVLEWGAAFGDMELAVFEDEQMRDEFRPKKQNNMKRGKATWKANSSVPRCLECGSTNYSDNENGFCVCVACGRVLRGVFGSVGVSDFGRLRRTPVADTRKNYFNERVSQWQRQEPEIPPNDRKALLERYNDGFGVYPRDGGVLEYDDAVLCKGTVRQIIIDAGLSPKAYTEKWLTIRVLLGAEPNPMPSAKLVKFVKDSFARLSANWKRHPDLHPQRFSLPNYNYLIRQFILMYSVDDYALHMPWFPVQPDAERKLQQSWCAMCRLCEWPMYFADIDANGRVTRYELKQLSSFV